MGGGTEALIHIDDFMGWIEKLKEKNSHIILKIEIDCEGYGYEIYRDPGKVLLWKNLGVKEVIMEYHEGVIMGLLENWRSNWFLFAVFLKK